MRDTSTGVIRSLASKACWVAALLLCGCLTHAQYPEDDLIALARQSVVATVQSKPLPRVTTEHAVAPVFVTIERNGQVVGCRGSLVNRGRSLEEAVILAAASAAGHDPRYPPLKAEHLKDFLVTVTIVERLDRIDNIDNLQPKHGLVLKSGSRTGVVLPWEGKDPHVRLEWAHRKAGVPKGSSVSLQVLIGTRFRG